MNFSEFSNGMNRLASVFGKNVYGDERVKLFWRECETLPASWWNKTIDRWLGDLRTPPLMPELRTEIATHREREGQREKAQKRDESLETHPALSISERLWAIKGIKMRAQGVTTHENWNSFLGLLERVKNDAPKNRENTQNLNEQGLTSWVAECKLCNDAGIVFAWPRNCDASMPQISTPFRCHCARGRSDTRRFKIWDLEARNLYQLEEPKWTI